MKTLTKITICAILYYSGMLHFYIQCILKKRDRFPAVIINYHRFIENTNYVLETTPTVNHLIDDFKKEIAFFKKYFTFATLDQVIATLKTGSGFKTPTIAITVDDGYKNNFDLLFPVLKKENIPVTIFLTAGLIGTNQRIWVDKLEQAFINTKKSILKTNGLFKNKQYIISTLKQKRTAYNQILRVLKDAYIEERESSLAQIEQELGTNNNQEPVMLNWEEVRIMQKNNITFGAHTVNHPILTNMPPEDAKKEITDSKAIIELKLGSEVKHFAFPNGRYEDFREPLRQHCKNIGFESISTCYFGNNIKPADIQALKRIGTCLPLSVLAVNMVRVFLLKNE